ncbi:MAG: Eco57I restriction-modification methylase domain-containing protein, partial [Clostridia bacterium]|nr:Eco57I restriction-modification methylase domain-containing protein [Clostridia bacterium]
AIPIYDRFVLTAKKLNPRYIVMITPSRWFAGGKGLDEFRDNMLNDNHIVRLADYANSAECFPGVTIAGGVSYFLWDKDYTGNCIVDNIKNNNCVSAVRNLNEFDIFVRDNIAVNIIRKIRLKENVFFNDFVFPRNYFNLLSNENGHRDKKSDDLKMFSLSGFSYINSKKIHDRNQVLDSYKVIMTKAMSGGNKPSSDGNYQVVSTIKVLNPNEVCTETYLILKTFNNEAMAKNLSGYVKTKFFRFLLLQALTSINISKEKFCFVPMQDFSKPLTDEFLYAKYKLSDEEINFIESMIRPME